MKKKFLKKIHFRLINRIKSNEDIPVIIFSNNKCEDVHECIKNFKGNIKHNLHLINGVAATIPSDMLYHISRHHMVNYILEDAKVKHCMDIVNSTVESNLANDLGYNGDNIGVAVIDTGVAPHFDLTKGKNRIIAFKDFVNDIKNPYDDNGHGTHVAGIIAGNGYVNKKYKGVAPKANIIGIKVLDKDGGGSASDVMAGIQWALENKERYNIKIISLSLGSPAIVSYTKDPLSMVCAQAVNKGMVVVVAAGNDGPNRKTINSPGITPNVITVGCSDDKNTSNINDDTIADFSSEGPTIDGYLKPDVVAPGVDVISLKNDKKGYIAHSGTSMSTPVVSGAVALFFQMYPDANPNDIKNLLMNTTIKINASEYAQGHGLINVKNFLNLK